MGRMTTQGGGVERSSNETLNLPIVIFRGNSLSSSHFLIQSLSQSVTQSVTHIFASKISATCQSHASHISVTSQSHASHMPATCQFTCQSHVSHSLFNPVRPISCTTHIVCYVARNVTQCILRFLIF